jgi:hypothetical protein
MKKRKSSQSSPSSIRSFCFYGIWSHETSQIIFIAMTYEDVEMEFDLEGYSKATHAIVKIEHYYAISSLEQLTQ